MYSHVAIFSVISFIPISLHTAIRLNCRFGVASKDIQMIYILTRDSLIMKKRTQFLIDNLIACKADVLFTSLSQVIHPSAFAHG